MKAIRPETVIPSSLLVVLVWAFVASAGAHPGHDGHDDGVYQDRGLPSTRPSSRPAAVVSTDPKWFGELEARWEEITPGQVLGYRLGQAMAADASAAGEGQPVRVVLRLPREAEYAGMVEEVSAATGTTTDTKSLLVEVEAGRTVFEAEAGNLAYVGLPSLTARLRLAAVSEAALRRLAQVSEARLFRREEL